MKVVNNVKLKEEFDYESLCRKLETQVDHLFAEVDRQQKFRQNEKIEMKKMLEEFENSSAEAEKRIVARSEVFVSIKLFASKEPSEAFFFSLMSSQRGRSFFFVLFKGLI